MKNTSFLRLNMPELSDSADVRELSENMDSIDTAVKNLSEFNVMTERQIDRMESKVESTDTEIKDLKIRANKASEDIARLDSYFKPVVID